MLLIRTIPATLETKKGEAGTKVALKTNSFSIRKKPQWRLFQYRVDMVPEIDYTKVSVFQFFVKFDLGRVLTLSKLNLLDFV